MQDGTVVHCTHDWPTIIGAECVVGHNAHLEGCVVGDRCMIGSGSVTLNRAIVGDGALVGAGALVPEGFKVPPGTMALGVPCRIRELTQPDGWIDAPMQANLESARRLPRRAPPHRLAAMTCAVRSGVNRSRLVHVYFALRG